MSLPNLAIPIIEAVAVLILIFVTFHWRRHSFQKEWLEELRNRVADLEKGLDEERKARENAEKRAQIAETRLETLLKAGIGQSIGTELKDLLREQTELLRKLLDAQKK